MNELAPLVHFGLLLVRPGMLVLVVPFFGGAFAPSHVKVGLTVLLALALWPLVTLPPPSGNALSITLIVLREAAIGLALGLAVRALVAAVELAGHLTGFQLGLSYAAIIDPQSGVRSNVVATLYVNLTLVTLLLINGHHSVIRALGASYQQAPIGGGRVAETLPAAVIELLGLVFVLGTRLAAPLVIVLVLVEVAMGLMARVAPMLNLMAVGWPLRLGVGLVLVGLSVPVVSRVTSQTFNTVLELGLQTAQAFR